MKTVRVHQYGGLEVLKYEDVPIPEPKEGEARVKIEAIGVNFIDIYHRIGVTRVTAATRGRGRQCGCRLNVTDVRGSPSRERTGACAEYAIVPSWRSRYYSGGDTCYAAAMIQDDRSLPKF
jgi:NADPH2:quinone reductase